MVTTIGALQHPIRFSQFRAENARNMGQNHRKVARPRIKFFLKRFFASGALHEIKANRKRKSVVPQLNQQPNIEDLRHHGPETVEELRQLLASGASAKPDPHRSDFYELDDSNKVFYIHLSPVDGKILLLATWLKDEEPAKITACHQAAVAILNPSSSLRGPTEG
jgi:hypothetical protein